MQKPTDSDAILEALSRPFPAKDIEWRALRSGCREANYGDPWAMLAPYITNRGIMARLDEVFGIDGWYNDFEKGPDGGVVCAISVRINHEWITKKDGAENTPGMEPVKGGLSGSMKRAAVHLGIGRYLYHLDEVYGKFDQNGELKIKVKQNANDKTGKSFKFKIPTLPVWALPEDEVDGRWTVNLIKKQLNGITELEELNGFSRQLADYFTSASEKDRDDVTLAFRKKRVELKNKPGSEPSGDPQPAGPPASVPGTGNPPENPAAQGATGSPPSTPPVQTTSGPGAVSQFTEEQLNHEYMRLSNEIVDIKDPKQAARWTLDNAVWLKALGGRGLMIQQCLSDHLATLERKAKQKSR